MGVVVDARGRSCPEPVIMTRQAVAVHKGQQLTVLVDTAVAKENVARFLETSTKQKPSVQETAEGEWEISAKLA